MDTKDPAVLAMCAMIDPTLDWAAKDLSHVKMLRATPRITNRQHLLKIIKSNYWPEAVPSAMIVRTQEERHQRAEAIVSDIRRSLQGRKFLDFGCGSGECVQAALRWGASVSVGFDIAADSAWQGKPGIYTTDPEEVAKHGPYDAINIYDVLDHIHIADHQQVLNTVFNKYSSTNTIIQIRCHPWTARHGGHTYEKFNKAYAHIFLSPEEMEIELPFTARIQFAQLHYASLFNKVGFRVLTEAPTAQDVEPIINMALPYIMPIWEEVGVKDKLRVAQVLQCQFVDYILQKP